jgi:hypothetical protein
MIVHCSARYFSKIFLLEWNRTETMPKKSLKKGYKLHKQIPTIRSPIHTRCTFDPIHPERTISIALSQTR